MTTSSTSDRDQSFQETAVNQMRRQFIRGERVWTVALIYLFLLTLAEVVAVLLVPQVGVVLQVALLFLLLMHAAALWQQPIHSFLLGLAFVPLIRIVSLSLPLVGYPLAYWYLITSVPLFAAAIVVMRMTGMSWRDAGWGGDKWGWQLVIGLCGFGLGYLEYLILRPAPLVAEFTLGHVLFPALILMVSTGYLEELIFRRIMQNTAVAHLGRWSGIIYVSLFFAVLHIGYRSFTDFVFVLVVGLVFSIIVDRTRNLVGVTLAHGFTNISLFLIFPFLLGGQQQQLLPLTTSTTNSNTVAAVDLESFLELETSAIEPEVVPEAAVPTLSAPIDQAVETAAAKTDPVSADTAAVSVNPLQQVWGFVEKNMVWFLLLAASTIFSLLLILPNESQS